MTAFREWFNPQTNRQRRETALALQYKAVLLSQVEAGLVDLEQVLIGFWQVDSRTLYEHLRDSRFSVPQLTGPEMEP